MSEKTPWNPSRKAIARVKNPIPAPVECNYCGSPVAIRAHQQVYGRDYGNWPWLYICANDQCEARVGMHPFTDIPLGTLADAETRQARKECKASFNDYLLLTDKSRNEAYAALAEEMGIEHSACHFGWFDAEQCLEAQAAALRLIEAMEA